MEETITAPPTSARKMAYELASGKIADDAMDSDMGINPDSETDGPDKAGVAHSGSSSNGGYNGNGSTRGMTGIGGTTDTGSNSFISGAGGETDPGFDKGPVVGDGSEAFPDEVHGLLK